MLTCGVALGLSGTGIALNDFFDGKRNILNRLSIQADIVGTHCKSALLFGDRQAAERTLAALSAEPSIAAAQLFAEDGALFASYLDGQLSDANVIAFPQQNKAWFNDHYLHVFRPVVLDGERIGTVYLLGDLQILYAQLRQQLLMIVSVLLASYVIAFFLSTKLQDKVSRPILHLAKTAKVVSRDHNYALREQSQSRDELGLLINAFNEMLAQIQIRDEQLEQHNLHLEEQVVKRTTELKELNQQLRRQAHQLEELVAARTAELCKVNEQLRHLAYHDTLTGLPNRSLFNDRLTQAVLHAQRHGLLFALLFLDLDRFKFINDTLGHAVGDKLLQLVAERLRRQVRKEDTVARLGGDEFTILLGNLKCPENAEQAALKIIDCLQEVVRCHSHELHVTTSVGIAVYPKDGSDAGTLMQNADAAMYCAKQEGRNNFRYYNAAMNSAHLERLRMENRLRRALKREEFVLYYQPQLKAQTGAVVGIEVLLRWREPEQGLLSPSVFVPLLEETGLIVPVGEWVLKNACAQLRVWQNMGYFPLSMAINCSSSQFKYRKLAETVSQVLQENMLEPGSLTLEITENILMDNSEETLATLRDISTMGVQLAIDDFGTGYSSLSYLKRFPINVVKIDKSFVQNIAIDPDNAAIVKAIIAMAHSLNLKVIAEGVESNSSLEFLRLHQCDVVQGYMLGHPLAAPQLLRILPRSLSPA